MIDKKFYKPSAIVKWVVVIFESTKFFPQKAADEMVKGLMTICDKRGKS